MTGTINSGETVDFVNGTVTQNGTVGRITVPGEGAFFFDVGKYIIDFEKGLSSWLAVITRSWRRTTRRCVNCSLEGELVREYGDIRVRASARRACEQTSAIHDPVAEVCTCPPKRARRG